MNIADEIYTLEGKKEKLEYELMEEQYHYYSIPKRRSDTIQKTSMCLVVIFFSFMTILLSIKELIHQIDLSKEMKAPNIAMGVASLLVPIIAIASIIILIFFIRMYLNYAKHLIGNQKNSENYHSENFSKEAIASKGKLASLQDSLSEIDKKISYLKGMVKQTTPTIDSIMLLKNNAALDEEFFRYAYGTWGESQELIHMNIDSGKYQREIDEIQQDIKYQKDYINNLAFKKHVIYEEYNSSHDSTFIFSAILIIIIMLSFLLRDVKYVGIFTIFVGFVYIVIGTYIFSQKLFPKLMAYKIETNYEKYTDYAESKRLFPTFVLKNNAINKMKDLNSRLTYLNRIMEYKERHQDIFS